MVTNANRATPDDIEKLAALIKDIEFAMLTTVEPDGSLRSRPMATQKTKFDGTLWFFTEINSGKVGEIEGERHVNLAYADTGNQKYVSVSGLASVVQDRSKAEQLWSPLLKAWFPQGIEDPTLALLKVDVREAEYWDSPHGAVVRLVGFVKALTTGDKYRPGENRRLDVGEEVKNH